MLIEKLLQFVTRADGRTIVDDDHPGPFYPLLIQRTGN
jgi:hypothetical protein